MAGHQIKQLSRPAVDAALAALRADHARIATALYGMDSHRGNMLLNSGPSLGRTQHVAAGLQTRMTALWGDFTAFGLVLDTAVAVRARRGLLGGVDLGRLTELLAGPAVVVGGSMLPLPVAARALMDNCLSVTVAFDELAGAFDAVAARLAPIAAAIAEAEHLAADLGDPPAVSVGRRTEFAEVSAAAVADPLGATSGETAEVLRRLAGTAEAARDRLRAAAVLKAGLADRRAATDAAIADLAVVEEAVGAAYAVAHDKIVEPGLPAPPGAAPSLRRRAAELAAQTHGPPGSAGLLRRGAELDDLDRAVAEARARAGLLRTAAEGLIDRRAELRGRLDAYRVKAARLGFAEHPDLAQRHRAAHDLLYTQPCDLPAATKAVHGYQQLLATFETGRTPR